MLIKCSNKEISNLNILLDLWELEVSLNQNWCLVFRVDFGVNYKILSMEPSKEKWRINPFNAVAIQVIIIIVDSFRINIDCLGRCNQIQ